MQANVNTKIVKNKIKCIQRRALSESLNIAILKDYDFITNLDHEHVLQKPRSKTKIVGLLLFAVFLVFLGTSVCNSFFGVRCLISSNYLIWEATRPLADCSYCENVTAPLILRNISQERFKKYAYTSRPIIVKNAICHWEAMKTFDFKFFKNLYEETAGSYESLDDGCQFLSFKSNLFTLEEVFHMSEDRAQNKPGEDPWYVGWGNCHPDILAKVRKYYSVPEFLPKDAEFPATENIFFGYEIGAVMHLDYIPRLMWQGQVKGRKRWLIAPVPECEQLCNKFHYYVEPGDVVLLDTRVWYHSTRIPKGQFSLTVQSEYG